LSSLDATSDILSGATSATKEVYQPFVIVQRDQFDFFCIYFEKNIQIFSRINMYLKIIESDLILKKCFNLEKNIKPVPHF